MDQPTPDDKNWTWVLERPCPQCGFVAGAFDRKELGAKIRANAASWRKVLERGDIVAQRPPVPAGAAPLWSALEYACHVRDVSALYLQRLELMLSKNDPEFKNWDQDATAVEQRYWEQDPAKVSYALAVAGGKLADEFDRVSGAEWARTGRRSDGVAFTIESFGRYFLHDPVHHLWDVEEGFKAIRG